MIAFHMVAAADAAAERTVPDHDQPAVIADNVG